MGTHFMIAGLGGHLNIAQYSYGNSLIEHDFTMTGIIYILILHGTICSAVMAWLISTFKVSVYLLALYATH